MPVPSLLRDFSAPVILNHDYSSDELAFLSAHDSDPFNRWEASQKYAMNMIKALLEKHEKGESMHVGPGLAQAFKETLLDPNVDRALIAEALTLPTESYIAERVDVIDVDAIHAARKGLRRTLAEELETELMQVYRENRLEGDYRYDAVDTGRRRLKNLCLAYLTTLDDPQYAELALQQFKSADNMTDSIGAMQALNDSDGSEREETLRLFQERWQADSLVMDKWFVVQAMSCRSDTLDRVTQLMNHPLFSIRNPNKVRSLIGAFAHGNPINFHRSDGNGYVFVADRVLELDKLNPQVASRLVRAFSRWKKHESLRKGLMRRQLERMVANSKLSKDVYEVVSKSLK